MKDFRTLLNHFRIDNAYLPAEKEAIDNFLLSMSFLFVVRVLYVPSKIKKCDVAACRQL